MQRTPPRRYLGVDINSRMVAWCQQHLVPGEGRWEFAHHDVHNPLLGQFNSDARMAPFPCGDGEFSLALANSVFTHLLPDQAQFYLGEISRSLRVGGVARLTWFLFEKNGYPMMQDFQNALYINLEDPTNAVIFSREYVVGVAAAVGLELREEIDGFQQTLLFEKTSQEDRSALEVFEERAAMAKGQRSPSAGASVARPASTVTSAGAAQAVVGRLGDEPHPLLEPTLRVGEIFPCVADVYNAGDVTWLLTGESGRVRLQLRWGRGPEAAAPQFDFPDREPVAPGATARATFFAMAPAVAGSYAVTLGLTVDGEPVGAALYEQVVSLE
jgi:hypothetical protein